jgi:hypothetical protein
MIVRQTVQISNQLNQRELVKLASGEVQAIHIPNYYPQDLSALMAQRLINHPLFGHYVNAPDIGRIGMAYFETTASEHLHQKYYEQANEAIQLVRDIFHPYVSPLDLLRLQLQELWAQGANIENIEGQHMFVGLTRVFQDGAGALPHQDCLAWDAPGNERATELLSQLTANIYLSTSEIGGEVELWKQRLSLEEYDSLRFENQYGLDRAKLPLPDVTIKPQVGDLILFNASNLHAVSAARGGQRVTLSMFIGYRGEDRPLSYYS